MKSFQVYKHQNHVCINNNSVSITLRLFQTVFLYTIISKACLLLVRIYLFFCLNVVMIHLN